MSPQRQFGWVHHHEPRVRPRMSSYRDYANYTGDRACRQTVGRMGVRWWGLDDELTYLAPQQNPIEPIFPLYYQYNSCKWGELRTYVFGSSLIPLTNLSNIGLTTSPSEVIQVCHTRRAHQSLCGYTSKARHLLSS